MAAEKSNNSGRHPSSYDRIILLVDEYPPAIAGGIASWAWALSEDLAGRGHNVIVMAPRKLLRSAPKARSRAEVRYIGWHDWARFRAWYNVAGLLPFLFAKKNILIVGSTWQHLTVIARFRKFIKAKIICFSHGTDATRAISPPRRAGFKSVLRKIDGFFPTSRFLDKLVKTSFPDISVRSTVVRNGIDSNHFRPLYESKASIRATLGISQKAVVIVSAGRLIPAKGFDVLINAVGKAIKQVPAVHLVIAGTKDGEYESLNALAADCGSAEQVIFAGRIPYEKLPEFYNAADIGVLASVPLHVPYYIEDNFPLMLLEAAACGLPLLGTRCGGIPEIIDEGETGFVVEPGDVAGLADRILRLAADNTLRNRMGRAARQRVERLFTRERMTDDFLEGAGSLC